MLGVKESLGFLFSLSFFFFKFYLFIYFWLCWVFLAVRGLLIAVASLAENTGLSSCGSRALEHRLSSCGTRGLSCSAACGIFPDQGSNPCPLHWQVDS